MPQSLQVQGPRDRRSFSPLTRLITLSTSFSLSKGHSRSKRSTGKHGCTVRWGYIVLEVYLWRCVYTSDETKDRLGSGVLNVDDVRLVS